MENKNIGKYFSNNLSSKISAVYSSAKILFK